MADNCNQCCRETSEPDHSVPRKKGLLGITLPILSRGWERVGGGRELNGRKASRFYVTVTRVSELITGYL